MTGWLTENKPGATISGFSDHQPVDTRRLYSRFGQSEKIQNEFGAITVESLSCRIIAPRGNVNSGYGSNSYTEGYNRAGYANGAAMSGGAGGDPYQYHFGPGYYRSGEYGHFRFPYYSYRRPWYHPGFAGYNRDTNLPW